MPRNFQFKLLPAEAADEQVIRNSICKAAAVRPQELHGFYIVRKSIDARSRTIWVNLEVAAFVNEPAGSRPVQSFAFINVEHAGKSAIIVGAGPAGYFAALRLLEHGIKPIVIERGKDVKARRRDLAILNKQGLINPDSNYCFGEGGAGTYSDGKLYTRSNKRGNISRILQMFVHFGADESILYEAHPHIGTNKLPHIITNMRYAIETYGGEVHFERRVCDFTTDASGHMEGVICADGTVFKANAVMLATGHSARDIFQLLHQKGISIEAKPFALGVRAEHPQQLIDACQYHLPLHKPQRNEHVPPASYSLVQQLGGRGVFSFCMCPGGIIAPASTAPNELVVNGWSPSKRNNPYANSGMVTEIRLDDFKQIPHDFADVTSQPTAVLAGPLCMMYFQQYVERKAYAAGGGQFVAPAQRVADFGKGVLSNALPACSYVPGISSVNLSTVLPGFVYEALRGGFVEFGSKMKGYYTNEAVVVATESRTSSPVRIPRASDTLQHPQVPGLFPCGEGAGYAGGIVSAAMDGERVADAIKNFVLL
jgi:uncharacterized FAD-dependent dehydrogenase